MKKILLTLFGGIACLVIYFNIASSRGHEQSDTADKIEKKQAVDTKRSVAISPPGVSQNSDSTDDFNVRAGRPKAEEAQRILTLYQSKYKGQGLNGSRILDTIYALGVEKTSSNFKLIRELTKSRISNEEKVSLTRILGSFYSHEVASDFNSDVQSDLRDLAHSGNKEIGRTAVLTYSRLGYFSDSQELLTFANNLGYIDRQEYYGDLTHLLSNAPADAQGKLLKEIKNSGEKYSAEILSSFAQNPDFLKKLTPDSLKTVKAFLLENEPKFSETAATFGLFDAVRYNEWLKSMATVNGAVGQQGFSEYAVTTLNGPQVDPRNIIAFLLSPEGDYLIGNPSQSKTLSQMQQKITTYAQQNAKSDSIQEGVSNIDLKIHSIATKKSN